MPEEIPQTINFHERFSLKRLLIVSILIFVTALAISYPIWSKFSQTLGSQNEQIEQLESRADTLNKMINDI